MRQRHFVNTGGERRCCLGGRAASHAKVTIRRGELELEEGLARQWSLW